MTKMITINPRVRSGLVGESTRNEAYGVLPGEDRLVRDIMTRQVVIVQSSLPLRMACEALSHQERSVLIVCEDDEPVHALAAPDLVNGPVIRMETSETLTFSELIQQRVAVRCREENILADAMHAMIKYRAKHIPVLNGTGDLVGALSFVDAIGAVSPAAAERWLARMQGWPMTVAPSK